MIVSLNEFKIFMEVQLADLPAHLPIDPEFLAQNLHQYLHNLRASTFPGAPTLIQSILLLSA